jgi:hypothetical protein
MSWTPEIFNPGEAEQLRTIAQAILDLKNHPGWTHYEAVVRRLMDTCEVSSPVVVEEQDLVRIATRQLYKKGLKDALSVVENQTEVLASLADSAEISG